jgi:uncharacterized protein (TIGR00730 family)
MIKSVSVFCASSSQISSEYLQSAFNCGKILAESGLNIVYGGGARGSMGQVANGALSLNAKVTGVIPKFMIDLEWAHKGLKELIIVETMAERKSKMLQLSDAVLVLPGGSGTLEELFETISLKRLGMYLKPIIILNTKNYYDPLIRLLESSIKENFMDEKHSAMWEVINLPEEILDAINRSTVWSKDAVSFAAK